MYVCKEKFGLQSFWPCFQNMKIHISLTKLMVSHYLVCSTVTNEIAFDLLIRMRHGPLLSGAGFQIGNLKYYHFT